MSTEKKRIVILGAGFGGVYTYKHLHTMFHKNKNVELILVNATNYFLFTPLLHEVATGSIAPENIIEPIRKELGCCLGELHVTEAEFVSLKEKFVETLHGKISYDFLVLGLGATNNFFGIDGAEEHCFPLKSLDDALAIKNRCIDACEQAFHIADEAERKKMLRMVIIGGGPTGVELAAEMIEFFHKTLDYYFSRRDVRGQAEVVLIQRDRELIPRFPEKLRKKSLQVLEKKGVRVLLNTEVTAIDHEGVHLKTGEVIATHTPIWTAGVQPRSVLFDAPVEKHRGGILVEDTLCMKGNDSVFVLGDMASLIDPHTGQTVPNLAQVAVQQGKTVAENIALSLEKKPLRSFHYEHKGTLISLGQWMAAGEISKFSFSGHIAWWMWRTIYLSKLISWQKKLKVAGNWTLNLFSPRDISRF